MPTQFRRWWYHWAVLRSFPLEQNEKLSVLTIGGKCKVLVGLLCYRLKRVHVWISSTQLFKCAMERFQFLKCERQTCLFSVCSFNGPLKIFGRRVTFHTFVGIILGSVAHSVLEGLKLLVRRGRGLEGLGVCTCMCAPTNHKFSYLLDMILVHSSLWILDS